MERPGANHIYRALLSASTDLMVLLYPNGRIACANPASRAVLGYESDEMVDRHYTEFVDEPDRERAVSLFEAAARGDSLVREGARARRRDGRTIDISVNSSSLLDPDGRLEGIVVIVSEKGASEGAAAATGSPQAGITEIALDCVITLDGDGRVMEWNEAAEKTFGWSAEAILGEDFLERAVPAADRETHRRMMAAAASGDSIHVGQRIGVVGVRASGEEFAAEVTIAVVDRERGHFTGFVRDVSEQRQRVDTLRELARENELILSSAGDGIYRVDTDGRIVYANPAAAEILGCELQDLLGRSAHELMQPTYADGSSFPAERSRVLDALNGSVHRVVDEVFWRPNGTPFPVDFTSAPMREGGEIIGAVCVFADLTDQRLREAELGEERAWRRRIRRAIERDELLVYSQPIIDLRSGRQVQEELLIRMRGESPGEVVLPDEFLPRAEKLGLITEIDRWMLRRAIPLVARGRVIELNLSAVSMNDPTLIDEIAELTENAGLPPDHLIFEITETAATENIERASEFGERLEGLGCRLALDDFGTGFGAMTYLKSLPSDFLKIAIEFIADVLTDEADQRVVKTIVGIAREHGQRTIAEGVEDWDTAAMLREYGVDYAQGFLFGAAQPLE